MPDITNKQEYEEYRQAVADFIRREDIRHLSTSCLDWDAFQCPDHEQRGEPWFSWKPCECCGFPLGGNREYLYALDSQSGMVQFTICEDCVYYLEYGRLDDKTMKRVDHA